MMNKSPTTNTSNTTNLSIRMDKELKKQADQLFNEIGMNMSTAFNIFVKQAVREGGIPFDINVNPSAEAHKKYILKELAKSEIEANDPNTRWYSQEEVFNMLDE